MNFSFYKAKSALSKNRARLRGFAKICPGLLIENWRHDSNSDTNLTTFPKKQMPHKNPNRNNSFIAMAFTLVFWGARTFQQKSTETVQTAQKTKSLQYWEGWPKRYLNEQSVNKQSNLARQIQQLEAALSKF